MEVGVKVGSSQRSAFPLLLVTADWYGEAVTGVGNAGLQVRSGKEARVLAFFSLGSNQLREPVKDEEQGGIA